MDHLSHHNAAIVNSSELRSSYEYNNHAFFCESVRKYIMFQVKAELKVKEKELDVF